jgi:hypothetical protein
MNLYSNENLDFRVKNDNRSYQKSSITYQTFPPLITLGFETVSIVSIGCSPLRSSGTCVSSVAVDGL